MPQPEELVLRPAVGEIKSMCTCLFVLLVCSSSGSGEGLTGSHVSRSLT